jgi:hypothetical protein
VRPVLALAALIAAGAFVLTLAGHDRCQDARAQVFAASMTGDPADDAVVTIRERCRGTAGLLAAAGALRAQGREAQALGLAREAAAAEPGNAEAWAIVAATASGEEERAATRRLAVLDPLSLRRGNGRPTR